MKADNKLKILLMAPPKKGAKEEKKPAKCMDKKGKKDKRPALDLSMLGHKKMMG